LVRLEEIVKVFQDCLLNVVLEVHKLFAFQVEYFYYSLLLNFFWVFLLLNCYFGLVFLRLIRQRLFLLLLGLGEHPGELGTVSTFSFVSGCLILLD
jgi:hypothetical protein